MTHRPKLHRRTFLRGAFGITFALPFLEGVPFIGARRKAWAADPDVPTFFVAVRSGNGITQENRDEPERFWPFEKGRLTREVMERTDAMGDLRATGELVDLRDDILIVSGTKYSYPGNGCGHSGGGNQCLTAAPPSANPSRNRSLAMGESVDNLIQRKLSPQDTEPLTLAAGRSSGYLDEVLSYNLPLPGETNGRLRSAERNPWKAYTNIFGEPGNVAEDFLYNQLVEQRRSVNDLVKEQLDTLKGSTVLSQGDKLRLELHQDSVRDLERRMISCHLPDMRIGEIRAAGESERFRDDIHTIEMNGMMNDILVLAFACGLKRAATLQIGNGNDGTRYPIGGPGANYSFHWISHRIEGDGGSGSAPSIENAEYMHYQIDRIHMRMYADLVTKLRDYQMPGGSRLIDHGVAMWTNDLSTGIGHSYRNLPHILAGSAKGYLRTGEFIDARDTGDKAGDGYVAHNQVFNTIINAVGVRQDDGSPVTDFGHKGGNGHAQAKGGELPGMKAGA